MTTQAYIKSIEAENELLRNKIEAYENAFDIVRRYTYIDPNAKDSILLSGTIFLSCNVHGKLYFTTESSYLTKEEFDILSKFISVAEKKTNRNFKKTP